MIVRSYLLKMSHRKQTGLRSQRSIPGPGMGRARWTSALMLFLLASTMVSAQDKQAASEQSPKTAPATAQTLSSYEGQNVASVEIAGHPEWSTAQFESLFAQKAGTPFSTDAV